MDEKDFQATTRKVAITYSRAVKVDDLDPEVKKLPAVIAFIAALAKNPKAKQEIPFGSEEDETMVQAADLRSAIAIHGEDSVFDTWSRQDKTDYQNKKAMEKANKATKPEKRKGGEVVRIKL